MPLFRRAYLRRRYHAAIAAMLMLPCAMPLLLLRRYAIDAMFTCALITAMLIAYATLR